MQIEYCEEQEKVLEPDDPDGGWVDTHHNDPDDVGLEEKVSEMTFDTKTGVSEFTVWLSYLRKELCRSLTKLRIRTD